MLVGNPILRGGSSKSDELRTLESSNPAAGPDQGRHRLQICCGGRPIFCGTVTFTSVESGEKQCGSRINTSAERERGREPGPPTYAHVHLAALKLKFKPMAVQLLDEMRSLTGTPTSLFLPNTNGMDDQKARCDVAVKSVTAWGLVNEDRSAVVFDVEWLLSLPSLARSSSSDTLKVAFGR